MRNALWVAVFVLASCQEYTIDGPATVPVATPPAPPDNRDGDPPDWNDCFQGFLGEYTNLPANHPFVEPDPLLEEGPLDFTTLDWWDQPSFQQFSPSLDFGSNWWPVDEGLAGDPAYFAVRWNAWIRAWDDTTLEFSLGSADDVWILINDELVFSDTGIKNFDPQTYTIDLEAGQYPMEIRFAHRSGESGFRFRVLSPRGQDGTSICYAEYDDGSTPAP